MLNNLFFENRAVYEIMWKKYGTAGQATDDNVAHFMLYTSGYKHTFIYVIIIAFPLQQRLREFASMLRYMYIVNIVNHAFL
jgi:hypothetical protein